MPIATHSIGDCSRSSHLADDRLDDKGMFGGGDSSTKIEKGESNQGPSWLSENTGKLVLLAVVFIIVMFVITAIQDGNR